MKLSLDIPSIRLPRVPSFRISYANPKFRIPFLSLLVEPRSLKKWLFIWAFCLYLVFCWACYFVWEQPRLNRESGARFGADSPTYWEEVDYRKEHADTRMPLISFSANMLGPIAIGMALQTGFVVVLFDMLLFFVAVEVASSIPGVDRYRLLFLLAISAETAPALVTLNKEILVLLSVLLLAKYIYSEKPSRLLLGLVLFISLFARWEQIAIILLFIFLRRKGSFFARNPRLAVLSVIAVLTVAYGLIARIPGSGIAAFTQYTKNANTIAKLDAIQDNFGFPLVLAPKIIMDVSGELLRPRTYLREFETIGWGDIHSMFILPLFSMVLIPMLVIAYRRGLLNPKRPIALLILIYLLMTAVTPFVQPRYIYFVYVLLCLEFSRKENPDEEDGREITPPSKNVPRIADLNRSPEYLGF